MKIIKPGRLPAKTIGGTCANCGCIVDVEPQEARDFSDRRGGEPEQPGVMCPTAGCGSIIWVKPVKSP